MYNLKGKTVFVTGGSRGIGAEIVKYLAQCGAQVAFSYSSNKDNAQALLETLPNAGHKIYSLDISSEESVKTCFESYFKDYETIFGLVNNAGITNDKLLLRMKASDFDKVINTNLRGCFLTTKTVLKHMVKNHSGSIVNISSVIGQMGNAGQANYAASKAGMIGFTKSTALEVGGRHIRANCVAPGFIESPMTKSLTEGQIENIQKNISLGRLGLPLDIAYSVGFLLSEQSSYITGQTLGVNGGLYM